MRVRETPGAGVSRIAGQSRVAWLSTSMTRSVSAAAPRGARQCRRSVMSDPILTTSAGAPIADNQNSLTAGPRGPVLLQDYPLIGKLAHQNRERIPERVVHAKGWGAYGTFTVTKDITRYTRAKIFSD